MPYDPTTFDNLFPYPSKQKIREAISSKILSGELKAPSDQVLDIKKWIDEKVDAQFKSERQKWNESEREAVVAWQKFQEEQHEFVHFPDTLKKKIHGKVWEDNHSGGYMEMGYGYENLMELVLEAYETGVREHLQRK